MDTEEPVAIITAAERWTDFAAALNALARFAGIEAEREYTRERKRRNKADQRERDRATESDVPTRDQDAARLTG